MTETPGEDRYQTSASMFRRLKSADTRGRELGWEEFRNRYAPIIAGFARNLGARPQDVDDIIQDVFLGFFTVSDKFVYDPSKGRFRGYLKTVTLNAMRARSSKLFKLNEVPLSALSDDSQPVQQSWDRAWADQVMRRAIELARQAYADHPRTFEIFERYALKKQPAAEVARAMQVPVQNVYQAKHRVLETLRAKVRELDAED